MRRHFYFLISVFFWLTMVVGFSDNWLTDRGQPSNSDWRFLVHALFAFSWFSILVIQTRLMAQGNRSLHMKLGIAGMAIFAGFLLTTLPFYFENYTTDGRLAPLSMMVFSQLVVATVLIALGFARRKSDSEMHKTNIIVGSLLLLQPAMDRAIGHIFGGMSPVWILVYLLLFGSFVWFHKGFRWQVVVAFVTWAAALAYFIVSISSG